MEEKIIQIMPAPNELFAQFESEEEIEINGKELSVMGTANIRVSAIALIERADGSTYLASYINCNQDEFLKASEMGGFQGMAYVDGRSA